jgi:hypothetical protein
MTTGSEHFGLGALWARSIMGAEHYGRGASWARSITSAEHHGLGALWARSIMGSEHYGRGVLWARSRALLLGTVLLAWSCVLGLLTVLLGSELHYMCASKFH